MVAESTETAIGGALENPLSGCRRCKVEKFTESLRQKDRAGLMVGVMPVISFFRAAGFGGIFYFKEEIPCRHFLTRL
jgi:hypothetical protein